MKLLQVVKDDDQVTPEKFILMSEDDFKKTQQKPIEPPNFNLKQLGKFMGKETTWIKDNILTSPRFRDRLDVKKSKDGCVWYGKSGAQYQIEPLRFKKFVTENFTEIYRYAKPVKK